MYRSRLNWLTFSGVRVIPPLGGIVSRTPSHNCSSITNQIRQNKIPPYELKAELTKHIIIPAYRQEIIFIIYRISFLTITFYFYAKQM
jgi:hypothetical protein